MSNELEPCPFCGGESFLYKDANKPDMFFIDCTGCKQSIMGFKKEEEAIKFWNRRYKHTCHMEKVKEWGPEEYWPVYMYKCSTCGGMSEGNDYEPWYSHCPNCGAEVVDGK